MEREEARSERDMLDENGNRLMRDIFDQPEEVGESKVKGDVVTKKLGYNWFMTGSVWKIGKLRSLKDDVLKIRRDASEQKGRKFSIINKAIKGAGKNRDIGTFNIKDDVEVRMPLWTNMWWSYFQNFTLTSKLWLINLDYRWQVIFSFCICPFQINSMRRKNGGDRGIIGGINGQGCGLWDVGGILGWCPRGNV